jgi:hypothetical protein
VYFTLLFQRPIVRGITILSMRIAVPTNTAPMRPRTGAYPPVHFLDLYRAYLAVATAKPALAEHSTQIVGSPLDVDTLHLGAIPGTIEMIEQAS